MYYSHTLSHSNTCQRDSRGYRWWWLEEGIGRSAADTVVDIAVGTADQTAAGIVDRTEMEPLENRAVDQGIVRGAAQTHLGRVVVPEIDRGEEILPVLETVPVGREIERE